MKVVFEDGHFKYVHDNPIFDRFAEATNRAVLRRSLLYKELDAELNKKVDELKANNKKPVSDWEKRILDIHERNKNESFLNFKDREERERKKYGNTKSNSRLASEQKTPTVTIPESFGDVTLDQARAELNDYYSNLGLTKDVSKMSDLEVVDEFIKYLNFLNSKLTDDYYKENPILQLQSVVTPKYRNVDLTRGDVRNIMRLYGYNPYADFTASLRRAIRKRAAGDTTQDMEWLKNYDHKLNNESLYDFFVTYRKKGGLISNNVVKRFKTQYNPFRVR